MKLQLFLLLSAIIFFHSVNLYSNTDANIFGDVKHEGKHLPGVTVYIKGTNIGVLTDKTGHYILTNLPIGEVTISAKMIGFKELEKIVLMEKGKTIEVNFELEPVSFNVKEVVVTGTRTEKRITDSPIIVTSVDGATMEKISANNVCEVLNFQPGLRTEVDCQTCNYTQLRMNGLPGSYSQILINGKSIFSPITGLYGLEQIPTTMIDRIEVVKGGASALYGSSAIGGTVNIITKFPQENNYNISMENRTIDGRTNDNFLNANLSFSSDKAKEGVTLFASRRLRGWYDANGDGFSEMPEIENNSFGATGYYRPNFNHEIQINLSSIYEYRRGGDSFSKPAYLAEQSEERKHNVFSGSIDYKHYFNNFQSSVSVYGGGQNTARDHYTGILPDTSDRENYFSHINNPPYGKTKNTTLQAGAILNHTLNSGFGGFEFAVGSEFLYDDISDVISAYNYNINQLTRNVSLFAQINWEALNNLTINGGLRADKNNFVGEIVINPRLALLFDLNENTQLRSSFSTGFRAPQVFDADLHIAFAGGGIQRIEISDDLKKETSQSLTLSINYDKATEEMIYGFTVEGFHTRLFSAFALEESKLLGSDNSVLVKKNGGNSSVFGLTLEARWNYDNMFQIETGASMQKSLYDKEVKWSDELEGTKNYLRSPDSYGYLTLILFPENTLSGSLSAVYTGKMFIPHYGMANNPGTPENDILFESSPFTQLNLKLSYILPQKIFDSRISLNAGVQNLLNEYQNDFDKGKYRDSGYIYGPAAPRTLFFGLSLNK